MQILHTQMQEHKCWAQNTPISCAIHAAPDNYTAHPLQIDVFDNIQAIQMAEQQFIEELHPIQYEKPLHNIAHVILIRLRSGVLPINSERHSGPLRQYTL